MDILSAQKILLAIQDECKKRIIGQDALLESILIALACEGHVLLEGAPGLAKTLTIKTLASVLNAPFSRIQFTPDLLPSDLTGSSIWQPREEKFSIKKGPLFASFVLADEINRAPAKIQSALLQAMEEKQITVGEETFALPQPFFVMATQNPIENEGTYPLPEAQMDRFLCKIHISYPSRADEKIIMEHESKKHTQPVTHIASLQDIAEIARVTETIYCDEKIYTYALSLIEATRFPPADLARYIRYGASPRASIALIRSARARALLQGRDYVTPEDIQLCAPMILRHRIILSFEALGENRTTDTIITQILHRTPLP